MARFSFFFLLFLSSVAHAEDRAETAVLTDGRTVYAYYLLSVPETLRHEHCDRYVFSDQKFSVLKNGLYTTKDNDVFLAEDNCLYPATGQAMLKDGRRAHFFVEDSFNTEGNPMYFCDGSVCTRARDGKYMLSDGQEFAISGGRIEEAGAFNGTAVEYESRD